GKPRTFSHGLFRSADNPFYGASQRHPFQVRVPSAILWAERRATHRRTGTSLEYTTGVSSALNPFRAFGFPCDGGCWPRKPGEPSPESARSGNRSAREVALSITGTLTLVADLIDGIALLPVHLSVGPHDFCRCTTPTGGSTRLLDRCGTTASVWWEPATTWGMTRITVTAKVGACPWRAPTDGRHPPGVF